MLAAVLRNTGDNDLEVTDTIQVNDPGPDDVIVKITHTGVCHSDVSAMNGTTAYTLGSGDDSLTVGGDVNLNVDGGAGSDTIVLTNATDYSNNTVSFSNIETIDVDANTI